MYDNTGFCVPLLHVFITLKNRKRTRVIIKRITKCFETKHRITKRTIAMIIIIIIVYTNEI